MVSRRSREPSAILCDCKISAQRRPGSGWSPMCIDVGQRLPLGPTPLRNQRFDLADRPARKGSSKHHEASHLVRPRRHRRSPCSRGLSLGLLGGFERRRRRRPGRRRQARASARRDYRNERVRSARLHRIEHGGVGGHERVGRQEHEERERRRRGVGREQRPRLGAEVLGVDRQLRADRQRRRLGKDDPDPDAQSERQGEIRKCSCKPVGHYGVELALPDAPAPARRRRFTTMAAATRIPAITAASNAWNHRRYQSAGVSGASGGVSIALFSKLS